MTKNSKKSQITAWVSIAVIVLITIALTGFAFPDQQSKGIESEPDEASPEVNVTRYQPGDIIAEIGVTGRIRQIDKIDLFSEVQGRLLSSTKPFRTGFRFSKGDTLVNIDDTEAKLNLNAQRSRFLTTITSTLSSIKLDFPDAYDDWRRYAEQFDPETTMPELPPSDNLQLKFFLTSREIFNQYYSIRSTENRLDKFIIVTPFDGELRQANATPGTLIQPGVKLGEFTGDRYELETFVSLKDLPFIKPGDRVTLRSAIIDHDWTGTISRIGSSVDPNTQAFPVFIEIEDPSLKDGLYLEGTVEGQTIENAVEIPRSLLTRNNTVLVAKDGVATHKEVDPQQFKQNSVIVSGLSADDELIELRAGATRLVGMNITVNRDS